MNNWCDYRERHDLVKKGLAYIRKLNHCRLKKWKQAYITEWQI